MKIQSYRMPVLLLVLLLGNLLAGCDMLKSDEEVSDEEAVVAGDSLALQTMQAEVSAVATATAIDRARWSDGYAMGERTRPSYIPSRIHSFNRAGGIIEITKPAGTKGRYRARFSGLSTLLNATSTAQVSAAGYDNTYCNLVNPRLANDAIEVQCFGANGEPANAVFTVRVLRNHLDVAYAFANQPSQSDYAPPGNASWNPAGPIRVFRQAKGTYFVQFTGLRSRLNTGGNVQVSTVDAQGNYCNVLSWGGFQDLGVTVQCYNKNGAPTDTRFNVLFTSPADRVGYAWADQPTSTSYAPHASYSWNAADRSVRIERRGVGDYGVEFTRLNNPPGPSAGDAKVTAYGTGNARCKIGSAGYHHVNVLCYKPNGDPVDTRFSVLMAD